MRTGELWQVDLGEPVDPEAGLLHPALVVSAPRFTGPLRLVCPVTTTRRDYPWRIEVEPAPSNGLAETSYVQTEHVRAIATARGVRRLGDLDPVLFLQVRGVLARLLDLP